MSTYTRHRIGKKSPIRHVDEGSGHELLDKQAHIAAHDGDVVSAGYDSVDEVSKTSSKDTKEITKDISVNQTTEDIVELEIPFTTRKEGNDFRTFVNLNFKKYAKDNDLSWDGEHDNDYIKNAYQVHGGKYQEYLNMSAKEKERSGLVMEEDGMSSVPTLDVDPWKEKGQGEFYDVFYDAGEKADVSVFKLRVNHDENWNEDGRNVSLKQGSYYLDTQQGSSTYGKWFNYAQVEGDKVIREEITDPSLIIKLNNKKHNFGTHQKRVNNNKEKNKDINFLSKDYINSNSYQKSEQDKNTVRQVVGSMRTIDWNNVKSEELPSGLTLKQRKNGWIEVVDGLSYLIVPNEEMFKSKYGKDFELPDDWQSLKNASFFKEFSSSFNNTGSFRSDDWAFFKVVGLPATETGKKYRPDQERVVDYYKWLEILHNAGMDSSDIKYNYELPQELRGTSIERFFQHAHTTPEDIVKRGDKIFKEKTVVKYNIPIIQFGENRGEEIHTPENFLKHIINKKDPNLIDRDGNPNIGRSYTEGKYEEIVKDLDVLSQYLYGSYGKQKLTIYEDKTLLGKNQGFFDLKEDEQLEVVEKYYIGLNQGDAINIFDQKVKIRDDQKKKLGVE